MRSIAVSLLIGAAAGLADILPMVVKKMDRIPILSAFIHYVVVAFVVAHVAIPGLPWWIRGPIVAFIMSLPVAVLMMQREKKSVPVILSMSLVLGCGIGIALHYLIEQH
ncbi:MAG: hypothetical protein JXA20_16760 [Spirochaetes bacterium]|nr:hypothetical protein [Spirochaetota bacterium]